MTPFGHHLEIVRRRRGLSQSQLAADVGIQSGYICAMEKGHKGPASKKVIDKIINVLKLSATEQTQLWFFVTQSKLTRRIPASISTREFALVHELWEKLGTLSEDQISIMLLTLKMKTDEKENAY